MKLFRIWSEDFPVIFIPRWAMTKCQPIAIRDVIKYLVGVLEVPETSGRSFDIGGEDILNYFEMLKTRAELLSKKRFFSHSFPFCPYILIWEPSLPQSPRPLRNL